MRTRVAGRRPRQAGVDELRAAERATYALADEADRRFRRHLARCPRCARAEPGMTHDLCPSGRMLAKQWERAELSAARAAAALSAEYAP